MKTLALLMIPVVAACGRMGFDQSAGPDGTSDAAIDRLHLMCGAPARFSVGATTSRLAAASTPGGYNVFTVDDTGEVRGFTYELTTGTPVAQLDNVAITSNANGPLGSIALGDKLLLAVPYGRPVATGTQLVPLDAQLATRGQPTMQDGWFGSFNTLAATGSGTLAFLGQLGNGEVDAKLVSPLGVDLGAPHPVIDQADGASLPTILPTATGFVVVWAANAPSPNEVHAELLDAQLAIQTPATTVSFPTQFDAEVPRIGYSTTSGTYMFAWVEKTGQGDQIWVSLRDASLNESQHLKIGSGYAPAIVAGDNDFLVVWEDGSQLDAARITMGGQVTPLSILGSGGKFAAWDLVVHNGQPAVVWAETGGTGANLWLDPLCN